MPTASPCSPLADKGCHSLDPDGSDDDETNYHYILPPLPDSYSQAVDPTGIRRSVLGLPLFPSAALQLKSLPMQCWVLDASESQYLPPGICTCCAWSPRQGLSLQCPSRVHHSGKQASSVQQGNVAWLKFVCPHSRANDTAEGPFKRGPGPLITRLPCLSCLAFGPECPLCLNTFEPAE